MQDRLRQTAVIGLALLDIGSSFWLGERLNQEASTTPVYFLPFGPTFAIWGLIFSSALVYGVYQALPTQRERSLHRRVGWWVAVNAGLTALWNFTAGSAEEPGNAAIRPLLLWSTVGILAGMLFSLTQAFIVLRRMDAELTSRDRWLTQFPITVFFAWLNVAMIANTTAALIGSDVTGGANGAVWAAGMLLIAAALASMMIIYSRAGIGTLTYSGVIIWAVIGIFFNNVNRSPLVTVISLAIIVVVSAVTIYHLSRPRRASQPGFQGASS